jgi:hypothetical protein
VKKGSRPSEIEEEERNKITFGGILWPRFKTQNTNCVPSRTKKKPREGLMDLSFPESRILVPEKFDQKYDVGSEMHHKDSKTSLRKPHGLCLAEPGISGPKKE